MLTFGLRSINYGNIHGRFQAYNGNSDIWKSRFNTVTYIQWQIWTLTITYWLWAIDWNCSITKWKDVGVIGTRYIERTRGRWAYQRSVIHINWLQWAKEIQLKWINCFERWNNATEDQKINSYDIVEINRYHWSYWFQILKGENIKIQQMKHVTFLRDSELIYLSLTIYSAEI